MHPRSRGAGSPPRYTADASRALRIAAAMGVLVASPAGGQEARIPSRPDPPHDVRVLTLDAALELATVNNPAYRQSVNELQLTDAGMRAAWGAFLPTLDLNLGTGFTLNRRLLAEDFFGNPIENPNAEWVTTSNSGQEVSASLTLFEGGRRFHQRSLERAQGVSRTRAAEQQLTTTHADVSTQFYETLEQSDILRLEQEILDGKRRDLESTQRLFQLASVSRVDVLAAELEVQQQERAVRQAESDNAKALLALRVVIGAPELGEFVTGGPAPPPFDPAFVDEEALVEIARARNPTVRRQEAEVDVGRSTLSAARGSRLPTLRLNTGFVQNAWAPDYASFFDPYSTDSRFARMQLNLTVPVFSGFANENAIAQADVQLQNAQESARQTRLQIEQDVRSRLIDLTSAYDNYRLAERSREIAEERLRLTREEYRLAIRNFSELQQAIEDAAVERREAINAHYAFLDARILLEQTIGGSLEDLVAQP